MIRTEEQEGHVAHSGSANNSGPQAECTGINGALHENDCVCRRREEHLSATKTVPAEAVNMGGLHWPAKTRSNRPRLRHQLTHPLPQHQVRPYVLREGLSAVSADISPTSPATTAELVEAGSSWRLPWAVCGRGIMDPEIVSHLTGGGGKNSCGLRGW